MKVSNETVYIAIVICLVGLLIVVTPLIVKNDKVRNFTIDTFNLVLLIGIAFALYFLDIRVGAVFTVLLLTFLAYAKLEGFYNTSDDTSTNPTEYANQFALYTPQTREREHTLGIETFSNCGTNNKPPSEQFVAPVPGGAFIDLVNVPDGTMVDDTVSQEAPVNVDTAMTSNVGEYMNQLQQDALTNKLKAEQHDFDIVGCRYDMTETAQSTSVQGPPLGWNDTYKGESVNGQLFYPLHG